MGIIIELIVVAVVFAFLVVVYIFSYILVLSQNKIFYL